MKHGKPKPGFPPDNNPEYIAMTIPQYTEILVEKAPPGIAKVIRLTSISVGLFIFGCLSYAGFNLAASSFKFGDTTMDLHLPHGLPQTAMVIGSVWFCLQLVVSFLIELGLVEKPDLYE